MFAKRLFLLLLFLPLAACSEAESSDGGDPVAVSGSSVPAEPPHVGEGLVILEEEREEGIGPVFEEDNPRPYYHSFGYVPEGDIVSHVFRLENRDPGPITIKRIKAACGCTVPRVRYRTPAGEVVHGSPDVKGDDPVLVLPAGLVAELEVSIDSDAMTTKNADKTLTILVSTDSPASYYLTLETHIFVLRPFDLVPNGINFGRVPFGGEMASTMDIVQVPGFELEPTAILSKPDGVDVRLARAESVGRPLWRLEAVFTTDVDSLPGRWTGEVEIATANGIGEVGRPLVVGLQADRVPDLLPHPSRLVFVARDATETGEVQLNTLLEGHYFGVRSARIATAEHADLLAVTFEPAGELRNGGARSWRVTARAPDPDAVTELLRGEIELELDDPQHPTATIGYVVHPRAER